MPKPVHATRRSWLWGLPAVVAIGGAIAWVAVGSAGISAFGVPISSDEQLESVIALRVEAWLNTEITIDIGTVVTSATRRELGGLVDQVAARELARRGGLAGVAGLPIGYDHEQSQTLLAVLQRRVERRPVPAVENLDGSVTPGVPGQAVELLGALAAIREGLETSAAVISVPVEEVPPLRRAPIRLADAVFPERVSGYETRYARRGNSEGRARNIELAAAALDGQVIAPGAVLSFNRVVGERSREQGFQGSVEIRQGRRVDGVGGGVCQVSATLHAAAFFAGFDIIEHYPHSRNLGYIEPGLDAAVVWPYKDLRIRNPFPFFVKVRARTEEGLLKVELRGERPGPPVEWHLETVEEIEPDVEELEAAELAIGEEEVVDEGEPGIVILRTRVIHGAGGERRDERTIRYPAASRLVRVGAS